MKTIIRLSVIFFVLFSSVIQAKQIKSGEYEITLGEPSDWVVTQALSPQKINKEKAPVHYRLVGRQDRFTDKSNEYYQDFAATALNQEGVKELSKIELTFNPEFEKLTLHTVEIERRDIWSDRLKTARINVINQEQELSNDLFNGLATAVIVLKDVRVGDTIRYQYSIKGRNPVYGKEFGSSYAMGWEVAIDKVHVRFINASGQPLNIQSNDNPPATITQSRFGKEYEWQLANVAKYNFEEGVPAGYLWSPTVFVSSTPSWSEVSNWAISHYQFDESPSRSLNEYIKEVTTNYLSKEEQVAEMIRFVQQDIRYFGIEIGQNSHIPHSPNTVFERRYGDCKDKASLLIALLGAIDVPSSPVLVNTGIGLTLNDRAPSAILFNHVINEVNFDGKRYFIDATNNYQAKGLDFITQPDFGYGLVLDKGTDSLVAMPSGNTGLDRVSVEQLYVSSSYTEPVDLYITTRYLGHEADYMRYRLSSVSLSEIEQHYLNYYAKFYRDIKLESPALLIDTTEGGNEILITEHYRIGDFWLNNSNAMDFGLFASYIKNYVELPKVINRTQPLSLPSIVSINQTLKLIMPDGVDYQVRDTDKNITSNGVKYHVSEAYYNGQFVQRHQFEIDRRVLNTDESLDYINALREVDKQLYYTGSINGDFSAPVNPGVEFILQQSISVKEK
ncbi:DUF3857 domain-containing transglutaminase family protein [Shewanella woodyi]|uniref:DUF3857 domain-containing protein n=1 Tax=Shewanella woodyi (strain ATCC 51908 / MS32) TaxID=392500 RepID=B1KES5_SHEWM|nr:DUF3857 domain-containing transglutaminase family protein [Shewanella woodyi]ACA88090.1 conserved hypothetical protein [Shewanella woodyi ATCC 51908]